MEKWKSGCCEGPEGRRVPCGMRESRPGKQGKEARPSCGRVSTLGQAQRKEIRTPVGNEPPRVPTANPWPCSPPPRPSSVTVIPNTQNSLSYFSPCVHHHLPSAHTGPGLAPAFLGKEKHGTFQLLGSQAPDTKIASPPIHLCEKSVRSHGRGDRAHSWPVAWSFSF